MRQLRLSLLPAQGCEGGHQLRSRSVTSLIYDPRLTRARLLELVGGGCIFESPRGARPIPLLCSCWGSPCWKRGLAAGGGMLRSQAHSLQRGF